MNKQEVVDDLSERCEFSKAAAGRVVDSILESIADALTDHEEVNLPGFGKFLTQERRARDATNPRDRSQTVRVAAATVPRFRPGTRLRAAVADVKPTQTPRPRPVDDGAPRARAGEWKPLSQRS
jgi:DNA-binding protein HU-beta